MSRSSPGDGGVSLSAEHRVDAVCQRFEAAWRAGEEPRFEDYLQGWQEPDRSVLLRELVLLDQEYRRRKSETPSLGSYPQQSTPPGAAATPTEEVLPRMFGRYTLRRLLGRGGMGRVYLAHDPQLDRFVALKMPNSIALEGWRERFFAEARTAATITHPNVCPVHEVGEEQSQPYLTMTFIEGETLAAKIQRDGPMEPDAAVALVCTAARAMQEAHRRGIVHRDLKPSNLMLDAAGRPIVMDFGLALRSTGADDLRLTLTGVAMGTPAYMPPEQAGGDHEFVGSPSDVYSLGVILYELVTGRVPFRAKSFGRLLAKIERDPPPAPSSINPQVDPALEAVILKCLAKDPADRFETAGDLADALDRYLAGDWDDLISLHSQPCAIPEPTSDYRPAARAGARHPPRRGWWLAGAAALVLALFAAGAVIYVQTDYGDLKIELSDPNAKVEVRVNGQAVTLTADGKVTHVKAGPGEVVVSGDGFETAAKSFTLKRGTTEVVTVTLVRRPGADTGKKFGDREPPVPAGPSKPVEPPKEPTLIEVPGWQILTDATKEETQKWLDERKKARHSVMWIDQYQIGDRPVYAAVAALDDREPNWTVLFDILGAEVADVTRLRRRLDTAAHRIVSVASYPSPSDVDFRTVLLFHPRKVSWGIGPGFDENHLATMIRNQNAAGHRLQLLRPFIYNAQRSFAVYAEAGKEESDYVQAASAEELTRFLEDSRSKGYHPTTVAASTLDGEVRFSAVAVPDPNKTTWEVHHGLTAPALKLKASAMADKGFHPTCVTAYPWDGAVRYCVVWVKEPPRPVPYPKEPTLVEAPGWQFLTDATKDEMQKWLDERKKAGHSVTWLDSTLVGDKPLFSAVAALDARDPNWQAFLALSAPTPKRLSDLFRPFLDPDNHLPVALSAFGSSKQHRVTCLWRKPEVVQYSSGSDFDALHVEDVLTKVAKGDYVLSQLRPNLSNDLFAFSYLAIPKPGARSEHLFTAKYARLTEFLHQQREKGRRPSSLAACPVGNALLFTAVAIDDPTKAQWEVDTDVTALALTERARAQLGRGFTPTSVTAYPWDGAVRYCVIWVKEPPKPPSYPKEKTLIEVPGWQILTDATKDEMQKWLDERKKDKHSVTWLDVAGIGGKPVYAAVAMNEASASEWRAVLDVPAAPIEAELAKLDWKDRPNEFLAVSGYFADGKPRLAMLAYPNLVPWRIYPDTGREDLELVRTKVELPGFGYRAFRPYPGQRGETTFAIVTQKMADDGDRKFDLSAAETQKYIDQERAAGRRLTSLVAYAVHNDLRFAAISTPNRAKWEWETDTNLPAAELKVRSAALAAKGFRPASVTLSPWDGAVRYCVVWVKEPPKD
jgi:hypothetical protein